jgi:Lhr-like helicase
MQADKVLQFLNHEKYKGLSEEELKKVSDSLDSYLNTTINKHRTLELQMVNEKELLRRCKKEILNCKYKFVELSNPDAKVLVFDSTEYINLIGETKGKYIILDEDGDIMATFTDGLIKATEAIEINK